MKSLVQHINESLERGRASIVNYQTFKQVTTKEYSEDLVPSSVDLIFFHDRLEVNFMFGRDMMIYPELNEEVKKIFKDAGFEVRKSTGSTVGQPNIYSASKSSTIVDKEDQVADEIKSATSLKVSVLNDGVRISKVSIKDFLKNAKTIGKIMFNVSHNK